METTKRPATVDFVIPMKKKPNVEKKKDVILVLFAGTCSVSRTIRLYQDLAKDYEVVSLDLATLTRLSITRGLE